MTDETKDESSPPPPAEAAGPEGGAGEQAAPELPRLEGNPPDQPEAPAAARADPAVTTAELQAMQAAEDAKGDPALDEVEAASIQVEEGKEEGEKDEPFEKLAARAKKLSPERVCAVVEGLLFLSEKPLSPEVLRAATGIDLPRVRRALEELSALHHERISGIVLQEVAGGWQLRSSPDVAEYARRFLKVKPQRLTRAALETLAIIAYRQPVTRPEIEEIRGVDSGAVVKALLERKLVKILGKKEEPGRPILYGTSREFLEFFALKDLASLPTLREFHELSEEHRDIVEKEERPEPGPRLEGLVAELTDPALRAALEARHAEGEVALEELERAIATADVKTRAAQHALAPRPLPGEGPTASGATDARAQGVGGLSGSPEAK